MTSREKSHYAPFDINEWHDMLQQIEDAENAGEQLDSDEERAKAFDERAKEAAAGANAAYYAGEGDVRF